MTDQKENEGHCWLDDLDGPKYYCNFEEVKLGNAPISSIQDPDGYFKIDHEAIEKINLSPNNQKHEIPDSINIEEKGYSITVKDDDKRELRDITPSENEQIAEVETLKPLRKPRNLCTDKDEWNKLKTKELKEVKSDLIKNNKDNKKSFDNIETDNKEIHEIISQKQSKNITKIEKLQNIPHQPSNLHERGIKKSSNKFHSDAETFNSFSTRTPDRFRTVRRNIGPELPKHHKLTVTIPKTPNFSKRRAKTTQVLLSTEELQILEIQKKQSEKLKTNNIKKPDEVAKPSRTFRRKTTKVEPFEFDKSHESKKDIVQSNLSNNSTHFHARPIPKDIFKQPVGIPAAIPAPLTIPESPMFTKKKSASKSTDSGKQNKSCFNSNPTSKLSTATEYHGQTPEVYNRSKQMLARKEKFIEEELKKEADMRKFEAQPLPYTNDEAESLPSKEIHVTIPEPFHFSVDERGERYKEKQLLQQKMEEEQHKKDVEFKAISPNILKMKPFYPKIIHKPPTQTEEFHLATKDRASKWEEFENWKKINEEENAALLVLRKKQQEEEERERIENARKQMVIKANPIRSYKPIEPPDVKPLTEPRTPNFSTKNKLLEDN